MCYEGYVRIKVINQSLTWEKAFDYCNKYHTGPLRIENEKDQEAVEQWLSNTMDIGIDGPFWIGLRQSRLFGFWIWSNTTAVYSNWKNSAQPELPMSNPCGAIHRNGSWSDELCLSKLPFLCEEEMIFL
ncbi:dromaiocalcin-2-like [Scomber scombrus]|uniref:dromaiocalcin-2-like n=1 Tax=Scomber scombrus TaxID=13677 RepID=UPI002DDBCF19|nr:dromaiocalcin-2-like [Scomber scombrus]